MSGRMSTQTEDQTAVVTLLCPEIGYLVVPQEVAQVLWERAGGAGTIEAGTEIKVSLAQFKLAASTMSILRDRAEREAEEPIDITDPENFDNFVDRRGVVWYRHDSGGRVGFPVRVKANEEGCGWWCPRGSSRSIHFKTDDYHVRRFLDEATTIIFRPDL